MNLLFTVAYLEREHKPLQADYSHVYVVSLINAV